MVIDSLKLSWLRFVFSISLVFVSTVLTLSSECQAQTSADKDKFSITGHLWSIKPDEKQVTVMNKSNKATIKINAKTKININGNYTDKNKSSYQINDLKIGDFVRITYILDNNTKLALKIIAARY